MLRLGRWAGLLGIAAVSAVAPGCNEFDTSRSLPKRGTVGQEMFGVICDRVAAQALREDLSGDSFRDVCHQPIGGDFADTVDESKLPPVAAGLVDVEGNSVSVEKQSDDRRRAIARVEALGRRRADLIRAFEATFPDDEEIPVKDLRSADPRKSCNAPKKSEQGLLADALADMLGRMGDLYGDGTLPQSTESLARVVARFQEDDDAQAAWQRVSARQGYRPIATALGVARPVVAYPNLRDFSNASLRLLSADSQPYEPSPQRDPAGRRVPVPGPGNQALNKLLEVGHEELLTAKPAKKVPALTTSVDVTGRVVLSRPRENLEWLEELLYTQDDAFAAGKPAFIVRRDPRGYARIRGGAVPSPLVDKNGDGLPDVDEVGRFKTSNGSVAPSPFPYPGSPDVPRDEHGRVTASGGLLYDYVDTSRTLAAQLSKDLRPLLDPNPANQHETLMDMAGGLPVVMGPRVPRTKAYGDTVVEFDGVDTKASPILDVVHALGALLGDRSMDATLALARELVTTNLSQTARLTSAMSAAFDVAQKHPEAVIPRKSTFWDENLDTMAKLVKEPGLLEDLLRALATPEAAELGQIFSSYAQFKDEISYDRNDINGLPFNVTTQSKSELKTPVDRSAPYTGENRSALYRFLGLISDTRGVTACNKPDAKVHAVGVTIPGTYKECEVFKIEDLGAFYVDAMANAAGEYEPPEQKLPRGAIYMRPSVLRAAAAVTSLGGLIEDSSGITGMWPTADSIVAPTPQFLNRLVFFDLANDTKNSKTRLFVEDLQGEHIGTSVCPERVIDDPVPDAIDARPDGKIRGLRACPPGQWLQERGKNTIFVWEHFGFYRAMKPIVGAFVKHKREDLFLDLSSAVYRHYPGKDATADECRLADGKQCPRDGMGSYEGLIAEAFATDVFPALSELAKALDTMAVQVCTEADATGACTKTETKSGIDVAAQATRAALDPEYARSIGLTDRSGKPGTKRNDGTPVAQATPAYLLANALGAIDLAFDAYEEQHPEDQGRRANWRRARSQLVDQMLGTTGFRSTSAFANPIVPKTGPLMIDLLRSQLWAHCPRSFVPPFERCDWARDELTKKAEDSLAGPLVTSAVDVMDALQRDPEARRETERLLAYLVDPSSKNDALASVLASANDVVQLLRDDENLLPLYKVFAEAIDGSKFDEKGKLTQKSLVDAQMALLARVSGKYFDAEGHEICSREVDPDQVLARVLGKAVTPIKDGDLEGQTPLEVIVDVIADVNRIDPSEAYDGTLQQKDYASVSTNVVEFLTDPQRGLEQFYEVVRNGTRR